jgi:tetratricopeptide (TPR) repeat protein
MPHRIVASQVSKLAVLASMAWAFAGEASAQTDEIRFRPTPGQTAGRIVRGTIAAESPREIRIQVGGRTETVPVAEVAEVNYAGTPPNFLEARVREKAGDLKAALENYEKAASATGMKPFVAQAVKFAFASALAQSVADDDAQSEKAVKALQDFVKTYPNGRHTAAAFETLLNLVRSGSDATRVDVILEDLAKIPGEQGRARILKADTQADAGQPDEALKTLDSAASQIPKGSALERFRESVRIKALVGLKQFGDAEKSARALIDASDPNDFEALAPAYNALGDCLRAAGKPKDALIAYLHTDILFESVASEHARSLAAIVELWRVLEKPDRAEQTLTKLTSTYPRSPWVKKAQGAP